MQKQKFDLGQSVYVWEGLSPKKTKVVGIRYSSTEETANPHRDIFYELLNKYSINESYIFSTKDELKNYIENKLKALKED